MLQTHQDFLPQEITIAFLKGNQLHSTLSVS